MSLDFSVSNFSVTAQGLEVDGVLPPCLGKHVKSSCPEGLAQIF